MDEGRAERFGKNEALFREVNERLKALNEELSGFSGTFKIMCECVLLGCLEQIAMLPNDYERLRSDATLFAVSPGHEVEELERVVASREGYNVVRKDSGVAGAIAEATDPRS